MAKTVRHYYRATLLGLAKKNRPFILCGTYVHSEVTDKGYVTFTNIHPYASAMGQRIFTGQICDHVNIRYGKAMAAYPFTKSDHGERFFLFCKATIYYDKERQERGGVVLYERSPMSPIVPQHMAKFLEITPMNQYVDFLKEFEGRYAWTEGDKKWDKGRLIRPMKTAEEEDDRHFFVHQHRKKKRKKKRSKEPPKTYAEDDAKQKLFIPPCPLNFSNKTGAQIEGMAAAIRRQYDAETYTRSQSIDDILKYVRGV